MKNMLAFCLLSAGLVATSGCGSAPAQANPGEGDNCACDDNHTHPTGLTTTKFEFTCTLGETGQYVVAESVPTPDAITGHATAEPNPGFWPLGTGLPNRSGNHPNALFESTGDDSGTLKVNCPTPQGNKVSILLLYAP